MLSLENKFKCYVDLMQALFHKLRQNNCSSLSNVFTCNLQSWVKISDLVEGQLGEVCTSCSLWVHPVT